MLTTVVCMKVSVDTAQLKVDLDTGAPRLREAPLKMGSFDENALEEAVRLKEKHGGRVVALTLVAREPPRELILRALAMGADAAYLVRDDTAAEADSLATATILAAAVKKLGDPDLVLCGEGSLDEYNCQVGPRIAVALGVPAVTHVTRLELSGNVVRAHRALEDRVEVVEASRPLVLTVGQEVNEPRFPTVLQIMGSSHKPVVEWQLAEIGLRADEAAARLAAVFTRRTWAPPSARKRIAIEGTTPDEKARELARRLFEEGVVSRT